MKDTHIYIPAHEAGSFEVRFIKTNEYQDYLTFDIHQSSPSSGSITLKLGEIKIPFNIEFDNDQRIMENIKIKLSQKYRSDKSYYDAIDYCLSVNKHLDMALIWANHVVDVHKNNKSSLLPEYYAQVKKSVVLGKMGRLNDAVIAVDKALVILKKEKSEGISHPHEIDFLQKMKESYQLAIQKK